MLGLVGCTVYVGMASLSGVQSKLPEKIQQQKVLLHLIRLH